MIWLEALQSLRDALASVLLTAVPVEIGADASVPTREVVILYRGDGNADVLRGARGRQTLRVECWAYDAGPAAGQAANPLLAYERLAAIERAVLGVLETWTGPAGYVVGEFDSPQFQSDGDAFRPSVGSSIALSFEWRRTSGG